jgi:hypothetical protein
MPKIDNEKIFIKNCDVLPRDTQNLYNELNVALGLIDEDFTIRDIDINDEDNGINYGISTSYPHGLPERVGMLFFNIDYDYRISIKETSKYVYNRERYFEINIRRI